MAVTILSDHKILSAPVFNAAGFCVGSVDMLDIASYVSSIPPTEHTGRSTKQMWDLRNVSVGTLIGKSGRNPLTPIFIDNTAAVLVELFATGLHRALVFDAASEVKATCSQSDVIRFLADRLGDITDAKQNEWLDKSVMEVGLGHSEVVTISEDAKAKDAIQLLTRVSALAVVDSKGRLVGNFSASDLHEIYKEGFHHVLSSVRDYLSVVKPQSLHPVMVKPSQTLRGLITKLAADRIHRVWMTDESERPCDVISLTDVMVLLSSGERVSALQAAGDVRQLWRGTGQADPTKWPDWALPEARMAADVVRAAQTQAIFQNSDSAPATSSSAHQSPGAAPDQVAADMADAALKQATSDMPASQAASTPATLTDAH